MQLGGPKPIYSPRCKPMRLFLHASLLIAGLLTLPLAVVSSWLVQIPLTFAPTANCCAYNEARLWRKTVVFPGSAEAGALQPWFNYEFLLPQLQLRSGLLHYGSAVRLRKFVDALYKGQDQLKVGVIGGSISCGAEAFPLTGENSYFNIIRAWMTSVAKTNVTFINGCRHASPAGYFELCLGTQIPEDVNLVFVELGANNGLEDKLLGNSIVKTMERLIRRILGLPKRPAVVLVHVPRICYNGASAFYATNEDLEGAIASYYDVQMVSIRAAIWQLATLYPDPDFTWNKTFRYQHPGTSGHKAIADVAVHLFQTALLDTMLLPFTAEEQAHVELPLQSPMYEGNLPVSSAECAGEWRFKPLVVHADGWIWTDEGRNKYGYVAYTKGSKLVVRVDTRVSHVDPTARIIVMFLYLGSYTPMGMAQIECISGCSCDNYIQDAWHPEWRVSETLMMGVFVTQAQQCEMAVTVVDSQNGTQRESHKFKVSGVVVTGWTALPDFSMYWSVG